MDDPNRQLMSVFQFQPADLHANRSGRLSRQQEAVLRASSTGMRLGMAVFAIVMLGSVAVVVVPMASTGASAEGGAVAGGREMLISLAILGAVALLAIGIGFLLSRGYMAAARTRRISLAEGRAEVMSADSRRNNIRIKIGATALRLATKEQLLAFQPEVEYRVFYIAGPVALILSAEVAGGEAIAQDAQAPAEPETGEQIAQDSQVQVIRRGYLIVVLIGVLALAIPVVGILASSLPGALRGLVWLGLLILAIGFVPLALWWISPRRTR
jgi:hypothetical protein